jgi:hypothetical protein
MYFTPGALAHETNRNHATAIFDRSPDRKAVAGVRYFGDKPSRSFQMRMIGTIFFGMRDVWLDPKVHGLLIFAFSMIALATVTFWLVEGWPLLDAAFFSVVTISTIGYGNLVPETAVSKLFAMFYILVGLGAFVAAASAVAEALLRRHDHDRHKKP